MRKILEIFSLLVFAFTIASCEKESEPTIASLDVNYINIDGTWQLDEWNGKPLPEDTYLYIVFNRKDQSYQIYQKFDSMYARLITGHFNLTKDEDFGDIINGTYDYGMGDWNNAYIISNLLASGSMTWTIKDNSADVSKYVRRDKVPANIVAEATK